MEIGYSYDYDDVLIIPRVNNITSRSSVSLSTQSVTSIGLFHLDIPIIGSPMYGIMCPTLINELDRLGGIGIMHKFYTTIEDFTKDLEQIKGKFGFSIGADVDSKKTNQMIDYGLSKNASIICIDVANGYSDTTRRAIKYVRNYIDDFGLDCQVMSGNVVTKDGARSLADSGCTMLRVGIGSGHLCRTRYATGIGRGQITSLLDCADENIIIVSDGGIDSAGKADKSFVAGADLVMIGSLLGRTYESAHNGQIQGMASKEFQEEYYHTVKSVEGVREEMKKDISLEELLSQFCINIQSCGTYIGAKNVNEFMDYGTFEKVSRGVIKEL